MAQLVAQSPCDKLAGTCHLATIPASDPREKPPRGPRREATRRSPKVKGFAVWMIRVGGIAAPKGAKAIRPSGRLADAVRGGQGRQRGAGQDGQGVSV